MPDPSPVEHRAPPRPGSTGWFPYPERTRGDLRRATGEGRQPPVKTLTDHCHSSVPPASPAEFLSGRDGRHRRGRCQARGISIREGEDAKRGKSRRTSLLSVPACRGIGSTRAALRNRQRYGSDTGPLASTMNWNAAGLTFIEHLPPEDLPSTSITESLKVPEPLMPL